MLSQELVLDLSLNWSRPQTIRVGLWTRSYLFGSLALPVANPPEPQDFPSWNWPDTVVGRSLLPVPNYFDQNLELVRREGGVQVYQRIEFRKRPLTFFEGIELSGELRWLEKELEGLEAFLSQIPREVVRIWNQEIQKDTSRVRAWDLYLSQDRGSLLLILPALLPIELELAGSQVVLLFRGQKFPKGEDPVAFALEMAPELVLALA